MNYDELIVIRMIVHLSPNLQQWQNAIKNKHLYEIVYT